MATADFVFAFERAPGGDELEWIPLAVRMKLDVAGLSLGLEDWQALELEARRSLVAAPEGGPRGVFAGLLIRSLAAAGRSAPRALDTGKLEARKRWMGASQPPGSLEDAGEFSIEVDWHHLDRFDRYVLSQLAGKGRREQLAAAVAELGLL